MNRHRPGLSAWTEATGPGEQPGGCPGPHGQSTKLCLDSMHLDVTDAWIPVPPLSRCGLGSRPSCCGGGPNSQRLSGDRDRAHCPPLPRTACVVDTGGGGVTEHMPLGGGGESRCRKGAPPGPTPPPTLSLKPGAQAGAARTPRKALCRHGTQDGGDSAVTADTVTTIHCDNEPGLPHCPRPRQ